MSAHAAQINCPICDQYGVFKNTEDLRNRLITVSTSVIKCPVCQEEVIGLDKLTIHLFSHMHIYKSENNYNVETINEEKKHTPKPQSKSNNSAPKNKLHAPVCAPVKYVKIYPKLPVVAVNTLPSLEVSNATNNDSVKQGNQIFMPKIKTESLQIRSETLCNICGLQFVDKNILKMHRCLIHNIEEDQEDLNVNRYQCHICPKNFKMRGSLMVHMRVAHYGFPHSRLDSNGKNVPTDGTQSDSNDKLTIIKQDNKQWRCDVCHKYFTTKYFLKKHKRLHTGETPYSCAQCNKTFTFQQSYHKHLLYHNDEKPHVCNVCGRAFKELSTLHNHQRIHTGEKPFSCEACGKSFRQRVSYLVHRRIHTGVMPYKCTACDKSFRYKVSQRTHKCAAQPPGTVIRQSGDLVEKLKQKQNITIPKSEITKDINEDYPNANALNARELIPDGAQLSLENTETENLTLIADAFKQQESHLDITENNIEDLNLEELIDSLPTSEKNVPSPSEILRNLCLSHEDENVCSPTNKEQGQNRDIFSYL